MSPSPSTLLTQLETAPDNFCYAWADLFTQLKFNAQGLIPAIAQCTRTKQVLMLAWMNIAALEKTLATQEVHYFSRSRNQLWRKGETSGHTQHLINLRVDCDGDTLLLEIDQQGPACHTNRPSCFYHLVTPPTAQISI